MQEIGCEPRKADPNTGEVVGAVLEYTLDGSGRIVEGNQYEADGELIDRHTVAYDENGNATRVDRYSSDGALLLSYAFTYTESTGLVPNIVGFESAIKAGIFSRRSSVFAGPTII